VSIRVAKVNAGAAAWWVNNAFNCNAVLCEYSFPILQPSGFNGEAQMKLSVAIVWWNKSARCFFAIGAATSFEKQQHVFAGHTQRSQTMIPQHRLEAEEFMIEVFGSI
jgi:hypothetical protein